MIEASVDGLVTVDPAGLITDVNDTTCRMTGYSRAELIGTGFAAYFTDPDRARAGVAQTFEQQVVTDYRLTLARQAGEPIEVSWNASVFRDDSGEVLGIFASARDITDQARLQAQLSDERTYNRGLIEASLDGLITVDPMLVITDVNEKMCADGGILARGAVGSEFPGYFTNRPTRGGCAPDAPAGLGVGLRAGAALKGGSRAARVVQRGDIQRRRWNRPRGVRNARETSPTRHACRRSWPRSARITGD